MSEFPDSTAEAALERLRRATSAAQQLCDVLFQELHEELSAPEGTRLAALSQRLAEVASTVALLAPSQPRDAPAPIAPAPAGRPAGERRVPPAGAGRDARSSGVPSESVPAPAGRPAGERRTPPAPTFRAPAQPAGGDPAASYALGSEAVPTKLIDEQAPGATAASMASVQPIQPEIEIRDVRREEGPSAWVSSVGRLLARHAEDGLPFAVLLVEIVDVAHLERSETPHDLHGLVAKVEAAVGEGMRSSDHLSRETLGRYWLVAPETNGTGARMLAERLARLVRTSASHRGVPMEVAIGIAVCPDDGTEAPALAARADLGVYSARATGRSIAHTDPPA